jgi:hypothetical protein
MGVAYKRRYLTPILYNVQYSEVILIQGTKAIELNDFEQYLSELKKRIAKTAVKQKGAIKAARERKGTVKKVSAGKPS